ncbi:MAG: cupredoxin domain-containing protein [Gemmatimonadales bacterium]
MRGFRPALALCVLGLVMCRDSNNSGGCTNTTAVAVGNDFFSPSCAAAGQSATVTWTWSSGGVAHNVTFEDDAQFNSPPTQTAGTHDRTFSTAGTYRYRCSIHSFNFDSGMIGRVVVQ